MPALRIAVHFSGGSHIGSDTYMPTESMCCVRLCSCLLFGRSVDTLGTMLLAVIKVISTAVRKLHAQHSASVATCTSRV